MVIIRYDEAEPFVLLGSGHYFEIIFGLVVQGRISFKDFSFLFFWLWWPFCSADQNHLCYFG